MFAYESVGQGIVCTIMFIGFALWCVTRKIGKIDPEGKVKDAAKDGVVRIIGRWLK